MQYLESRVINPKFMSQQTHSQSRYRVKRQTHKFSFIWFRKNSNQWYLPQRPLVQYTFSEHSLLCKPCKSTVQTRTTSMTWKVRAIIYLVIELFGICKLFQSNFDIVVKLLCGHGRKTLIYLLNSCVHELLNATWTRGTMYWYGRNNLLSYKTILYKQTSSFTDLI